MLELRRRFGFSILTMLLLAGFVAISQIGFTATAQTAPPPTATGDTLVAGQNHSCALITGGEVQCWGWNGYGQLGDGTTSGFTATPTPVTVTDLLGGAIALAAGDLHTCAVLTDGQVQCWGRNDVGSLGNGSTIDNPTPVIVTGLAAPATALTAGGGHTCAVLTDGQVQCWGSNDFGQLGNGTADSSTVPVTVTGLAAPATALTAGTAHTCAVLTDGQVQCWGQNVSGQLGDGTIATESPFPVTVTGLTAPATALTAGSAHTCAVLSDGQVQCWGQNALGQLGDGTTTDSPTPVSVTGLADDATAAAASPLHTCASLTDGRVQCWGWNGSGMLGNGTTDSSFTPVTVAELAGYATALTAAGNHTCALLTDGQVQCWGVNGYGQLGDGTTTDSPTPVTALTGPVLQPGSPFTPPAPPSTGSLTVGSLAAGSLAVGSSAS